MALIVIVVIVNLVKGKVYKRNEVLIYQLIEDKIDFFIYFI